MAHIVIMTGGKRGLFNACSALIQQLQPAGHRITYACPGDLDNALASRLSDLRVPFVSLPPWEHPVEKQALSRWEKIRSIRDRQRQAVANLQMDRVAKTLQQLSPDLVLIDIEMHPHIMTAVSRRYAVALLCPFISIFNRHNLPPIHTNIVPGKGWRGQWWGIQWSWIRYGWQKWTAYGRDRLRKMGCDYISILRCYSREIDYPFSNNFGFNQWLVPYPHKNLPVLCLHSQALDFPHQPPTVVQYLGPMVFAEKTDNEGRGTLTPGSPFPSGSKGLGDEGSIALHNWDAPTKHPLIYCGLSSFIASRKPVLQQLIKVATLRPDWQFVVGLGGTAHPDLREELLPSNMQALLWAPQLKILQQADCAIINSGAHSITECIHQGIPMLAISMGEHDQNGNAARLTHHGLGIAHSANEIQKGQITANHLVNDLQTLLKDSAYRAQVLKMRQQFEQYKQENTALTVIASLLPPSLSPTRQPEVVS